MFVDRGFFARFGVREMVEYAVFGVHNFSLRSKVLGFCEEKRRGDQF
jgi:hypothetical protein